MNAPDTRQVARRRAAAPHTSMFLRMLVRAALLRRGRAVTALLAMVVAAAVATAMLNLYVDIQAKLRREFREQFDSTVVAHSTGADQGDPHAQPQVVKHVLEGDTVKLKSTGRSARVARKIDDDHFEVEMGVMKMKITRADIAEILSSARPVAETPVKAARAHGISVSLENENANVPTEINVIGQTVDDASREVERFVDRAFLAGLPRVRVVHGSGMGILRKALRQLLQNHPHVESVAEPPQNEGGGGATVVELRV